MPRSTLLSDAEGAEDTLQDVVWGCSAGQGIECAQGIVQVQQEDLVRSILCHSRLGSSEGLQGQDYCLLLAKVGDQRCVGGRCSSGDERDNSAAELWNSGSCER